MYLLIRDKLLKLFLSIPISHEITNTLIDVLIKKHPLNYALRQNLNTKSEPINKNFQTARWIIRVSSPSGIKSKFWGDTHFAEEIKASLEKYGLKVEILHRDQLLNQTIAENTVVLTIRGLLPFAPVKNALNLVWVISHPNQVSKYELSKFDVTLAASTTWAKSRSKHWNLKVYPLLQATNPELFKPESIPQKNISGPIFIGNSRGKFRISVKVASEIVDGFQVIGTGWEKFLAPSQIKTQHVSNKDLPKIYQHAEIVLNDHWTDMAKQGFISNRIFDVLACNGNLISDYLSEIDELFNCSVIMYKSESELAELLEKVRELDFGTESVRLAQVKKIREFHSFDQRAKELLKYVNNYI